MTSRQTGHTRDAGWQIGVSKTVGHPLEVVWDFLTSDAGTAVWLGHGVRLRHEKGLQYETTEGTTGETRSFHREERIRLTWQPRDWDHETIVQVTVTPEGNHKTVIRFHQERLVSSDEREQQRTHWRAVMAAVVAGLDHEDS
ncbi:SRPBCC domain-containing protein [Williamsia sp. 1135]|uniref:SRPBCC domain-containing protein n=1 Tax=Williamsia sp. 1135 TaxID=1889262 RepID=UPI000A105CDE|nr:SRPBCC domain-containing protein [Williamsia sp. 1135]ORM38032.1 activator of Hsp90 ATPase 1 family protein [Williamsia sp. 1135]